MKSRVSGLIGSYLQASRAKYCRLANLLFALAIHTLKVKYSHEGHEKRQSGVEGSAQLTKDTKWFCEAHAFAPLLLRSASHCNILARAPRFSVLPSVFFVFSVAVFFLLVPECRYLPGAAGR